MASDPRVKIFAIYFVTTTTNVILCADFINKNFTQLATNEARHKTSIKTLKTRTTMWYVTPDEQVLETLEINSNLF